MKSVKIIRLLPLFVGMTLLGCTHTPVDDDKYLPPVGRFTYYNT